jgi:hypothetical protein
MKPHGGGALLSHRERDQYHICALRQRNTFTWKNTSSDTLAIRGQSKSSVGNDCKAKNQNPSPLEAGTRTRRDSREVYNIVWLDSNQAVGGKIVCTL